MMTTKQEKLSNRHMKLFKELKDITSPEVIKSLQELHTILQGKGDKTNFVDSFDHFLKTLGPNCFRLPYLKMFLEQDYGEKIASMINELYHTWSKQYE